eukprot:11449-Eustigmatos_ZCMA.PRE.1
MLDEIAGEGKLRDVEVAAAHRPEEHLLRVEQHINGIDAVDLHAPIEQGARPVVVAHGNGELELAHDGCPSASDL